MNYCLHCEDEEATKKIHALLMIGVAGAKQDFFFNREQEEIRDVISKTDLK